MIKKIIEKIKPNNPPKVFTIKTEDNIVMFKAEIITQDNYNVITDLTGKIEKKFIRIMNGKYSNSFINNSTEIITDYNIDEGNYLENLKKYTRDCGIFTHSIATLKTKKRRLINETVLKD